MMSNPLSLPAPLPLEAACLPYMQRPIVLGLSGGRDSVALLCLLVQRGCSVHACHIHHGIRGNAADADAEFCRKLCANMAVPCTVLHANVPSMAAEQGISLETAGRLVRREYLAALAQRVGEGAVVALAHHADDQTETLLFRLARGSAGLRGMRPVHEAGGCIWLRPLLSLRRAELTRWLQQAAIPWQEDATNAEPCVARNIIRLEVLPALQKALARDVVPVLNRSSRMQEETRAALQAALRALPILDPQGRLYLPFVSEQPPPLRKAILHDYLSRHAVPNLSEELVSAVESILPPTAPACRVNLPGGWRALRREKRLVLERVENVIKTC